MPTRNIIPKNAPRAVLCTLAILLSACGGGGGDGALADPAPAAAAPVATQTSVPSAPGASTIVVPSPPDMSIAPPSGTVVTPAPLLPGAPDATAASADGALSGSVAVAASVQTLDAPVAAVLPDGATACQPSTCPPFPANGSVTNMQGNADPTAAGAYLLPGGGASAAGYPDLSSMPTMILPLVPIAVVEAPN